MNLRIKFAVGLALLFFVWMEDIHNGRRERELYGAVEGSLRIGA